MTEGRISPVKLFLRSQLVTVAKLVITTSSAGIIIIDKNSVNTRFFPFHSSRAKAYAASVLTATISAVVTTVKSRYLPSGTAVNADT